MLEIIIALARTTTDVTRPAAARLNASRTINCGDRLPNRAFTGPARHFGSDEQMFGAE
jgi:hypothetical protein